MRPEIAELIRWRYPNLIDHPSTTLYSHVPGMQSDVCFITHNEPEGSAGNAAGLAALGDKSKVSLWQKPPSNVDIIVALYELNAPPQNFILSRREATENPPLKRGTL